MVAFRTSDTRPILGRGPAPGLRFFFFALLSFGVMWLDQRQHYLEKLRYGFSVGAYPLQVLVNSPGAGWSWLEESFTTRKRLTVENAALRKQLQSANLKSMRFAALEQENLRLREMRKATAGIAQRVVVAEILRVDLNPFRHRVIINKGVYDGAFKGQALLDASGVFGQITHAGAYSSEAILISDAEHAIPVNVNRNGLRTIAVGTGDLNRLSLPFLATNADIKEGDVLVSSGLGGVFPAGYPVATITKVNKQVAQSLAEISAVPAAALDRDREVLLIWLNEPAIDDATAPAPVIVKPAPAAAAGAVKPIQPAQPVPTVPAAAPTPPVSTNKPAAAPTPPVSTNKPTVTPAPPAQIDRPAATPPPTPPPAAEAQKP